MLKKLLKYDFRSVKRYGFPILITILSAGLLGAVGIVGLILTLRTATALTPLLTTCLYILLSMAILVVSLAFIGIAAAILENYYKSLVTDEAYLTFTLPVRASDILWSKLINAFIWSGITFLATLLATGIMIIAGVAASGSWASFAEVMHEIGETFSYIFTHPYPGLSLTVLILLLAVAYAFNSVLLVFMGVFFGSVIAKKHKLAAAIGSVLGVNMIYRTVSGIIYALGLIPLMAAGNGNGLLVLFHVTLIFYVVALSALSVLFFLLTKHMMEKRLNLA